LKKNSGKEDAFPNRIGPGFRLGAVFICRCEKTFPQLELVLPLRLIGRLRRISVMLIDRGLQVMNVDVIGDAYAIASNYLRQSGAICDQEGGAANGRLLQIIVQLFRRGEFNRLRLANKAIAKFEAAELV
jgi:hypothetical protein